MAKGFYLFIHVGFATTRAGKFGVASLGTGRSRYGLYIIVMLVCALVGAQLRGKSAQVTRRQEHQRKNN